MLDSLKIYKEKTNEKADLICCDLIKIKKALDYSIKNDMEHEFIYSLIKFARNNPDKEIEKIIEMSLEDWNLNHFDEA